MSNAVKVSEIFEQASIAFSRLAHLTVNLKSSQIQQNAEKTEKSKWSNEELMALKDAITRFGQDLSAIAEQIETKSVDQIQEKIRSQEFIKENIPEEKAQNPVIVASGGRRKQALITQNNTPVPKVEKPEDFGEYDDAAPPSSLGTPGSNAGAAKRPRQVDTPLSHSKLPRREKSKNVAELVAAEAALTFEDYPEDENFQPSDESDEEYFAN